MTSITVLVRLDELEAKVVALTEVIAEQRVELDRVKYGKLGSVNTDAVNEWVQERMKRKPGRPRKRGDDKAHV